MAIIGFSHLILKLGRVDLAAAFFSDVLGMRCVRPATGGGGILEASALLVGEGLCLELRPADASLASQGAQDSCAAELTFAVDDLAATLHSMRDRGVEVVTAPRAEVAPGVSSARVRGPGGLVVGLVQRPTGVATAFDDPGRGGAAR